MSLMRDEYPVVSTVTFDPTVPNTGANAPVGGTLWYDAVKNNLQVITGRTQTGLVSAGAPVTTIVTDTNPETTAQDMQTFAFKAGDLNSAGRTLEIFGAGVYTTAGGQTPTVRIRVLLGTTAILSWTSAATTASATTMPWQFKGYASVVTAGASGTFEAHGSLALTLGTTAGAATATYLDVNTAVTSAIDLTTALTVKADVLLSSSNAGNIVVARQFVVKIVN